MYKELFDKKKLITFDLDGTILKSEKVWDAAFQTVAKTLTSDPVKAGVVGESVKNRLNSILDANHLIKNTRPISELTELVHNEFLKNLDQLELAKGFWPFAAELKFKKKLNLALVTNTSRVVAERVVAHFELKEVFDFIICGDDVKNPKPNPEIYKKTLARFKIAPVNALVFEDSLIGCSSAAKARIKMICVWDGETPQRKFPDEVVEFTNDFIPFHGETDTTYAEDIRRMAMERGANK